MSCRVAVELPHHYYEHGNPFHLRIDLGVSGAERVIQHKPTLHGSLRLVTRPT
jgi:hypothetical protein